MKLPGRGARLKPAEFARLAERDVLGARRVAAAALAASSPSTRLWEDYVWTFVLTGEMAAVVAAARQAPRRNDSANLNLWAGMAHLYLGQNAEALVPLERSAELRPTALAADALGRCQQRLGRTDEAIAVFEDAVRQPGAAGAVLPVCERGLLGALRDQRRWREAERLARRMIERFEAAPMRVSFTALHYDMAYPYHRWADYFDKAALADRLNAWGEEHPQAPRFWPESFSLPGDRAALERFRAASPAGQVFIVKPPNLSGGQGVRMTRSLDGVGDEACVVQRYLDQPWLLGGHKFHARLYLLVTSARPLRVWLHGEGIARLAPEPYGLSDESLARPAAHVTNTILHADHPALRISDDPDAESEGHVWSLSAALARMAAEGFDRAALWGSLRELAQRFVGVIDEQGLFASQAAAHGRYCFRPVLCGLDVLFDREGRPWLLECQRNPAMTGSPLVNRIHAAMFAAAFRMSVFGLLDDPDDDPAPLDDPAQLSALEKAKETMLRGRFEPLDLP